MNTTSILDQLLKSVQGIGQNGSEQSKNVNSPLGGLGDLLSGSGLGGMLSGFGGGALTGGAIGLMVGNKKARKVGAKVAKVGGLGALGVIAYKAYSNWQTQKLQTTHSEPRTINLLPAPQVEQHSMAILKALIAASKADGHFDAKERQLLDQELNRYSNDLELRRWFESELNKPLDPADVASAGKTPEMAAEMYIASVLMVDEENFMERSYLEELARQLKIDPDLKGELEAQVRQPLNRG
ncbi:Uncharacterized membrane protein YebE, DUF533 family [Algoriphagus alkaliphilus]|uniref:Uncharacterized membrane protein YebE, DUF533 family n=1 Tax=Algoriphagus alkaliphilus TaxID=279824 RepID=A0A1G5XG77_9BACT|nr:tellurite resistance TerB family protein [Algoriphagus alkaliphilus]MBA4300201.1 DUF533 domain-containing protein [Cyclobacterium sp.]SDA68727.1 Uncharacterized membrane protein YebE, DUF533 family [Algoriphagus alkaliphilus]